VVKLINLLSDHFMKLRQTLTGAGLAAALLVVSCGKDDAQKDLHSGIILKNMDTLVNPGEDFSAYVNGGWEKITDIPSDKSSYGAMSVLNDKALEDVKAIIESSAKGKFDDGSNEQKIGDMYNSFMDNEGRDAKGVAPIQPILKQIDDIKDHAGLVAFFGEAQRRGQNTPLQLGVYEDFKDPTKYMLLTWQGGIGLPEREYYFLNDAKSSGTRDAYVNHIAKSLELAGIADGSAKASRIMALETRIAGSHMKKEETRETARLYNKYAINDLPKLAPDYNWNNLLSKAGIKNTDSIVVTQVQYVKDLNGIVKSTPLDTWKDYLKWTLINGSSTSLTTALDKQNFEFYSKTLYGTPEQQPQWKRGVELINGSLGEMVGEVYVKKHFKPEAKERMSQLVDNLLKAYEESIKTLDWMSEDTKKEALKKVRSFTPKIGYPDKWKDYSALKVVKGDLYGNVQRSTEFEYNRELAKLGKKVDRDEWGMTPQTVNAYYNPTLNEIVFPAAILQPPFFDMDADDAVNYGAIGAVIGHEIGHGFDDQGSTFDGEGVMRNWWTPQDLAAFQSKTKALVDQYNEFSVFPDLKVNGAFTLGENIGDLGGLSIALKAYQISLNGKQAPKMDGFTGEQRLFIGWAQAWQFKARDEYLRNQVASDPHSPAKFRVNGIVRNIPEWYTAFDIKPGDPLYLAPEKRVKIW
jgi:putative endopeptidase